MTHQPPELIEQCNHEVGEERCKQCLERKRRATPQRQAYMKHYQAQWIAQRRADHFVGKVCVDCGSNQNLELDHVDPGQKVSHRIWSWSERRRSAEIAKTEPRCHDCHLKKTYRQRLEKVDKSHGSSWKYRTGACRCDDCIAGNTNRERDERHRREGKGSNSK